MKGEQSLPSPECHPTVLPVCAEFMGRCQEHLSNIDSRLRDGDDCMVEIRSDVTEIKLMLAKQISQVDTKALEKRVDKLEAKTIFKEGYSKGVMLVGMLLCTMLGGALGQVASKFLSKIFP